MSRSVRPFLSPRIHKGQPRPLCLSDKRPRGHCPAQPGVHYPLPAETEASERDVAEVTLAGERRGTRKVHHHKIKPDFLESVSRDEPVAFHVPRGKRGRKARRRQIEPLRAGYLSAAICFKNETHGSDIMR